MQGKQVSSPGAVKVHSACFNAGGTPKVKVEVNLQQPPLLCNVCRLFKLLRLRLILFAVVVVFNLKCPLRYDMCLREPLLLNCCFLLCRGGVRPMDVVSVTTSPPQSNNNRSAAPRRLFSFLSVAWGFVSDVDIESERLVLIFLQVHIHTFLQMNLLTGRSQRVLKSARGARAPADGECFGENLSSNFEEYNIIYCK